MKPILFSLGALALALQVPLEAPVLDSHHSAQLDQLDEDLRASINTLIQEQPLLFLSKLEGSTATPKPKVNQRNDFEIYATSPEFPNHRIRARNPIALGVDNVKQWSGYVDVLDEDKHFFFWFFESRSDPANDPTLLWINGGPGCSSATGQFFELGPSRVLEDLSLERNPYSWNSNANVIFLDQPVNVGFSYSSNNVDTTELAGKDVYSFLSLFFNQFPEYARGDFHISGESYAGHYLPAIGHEIIQHEDRNFNLTSVLIGNGVTDEFNQAESVVGMTCGMGGYKSVAEPAVCDDLYRKLPRCQQAISACYKTHLSLACVASEMLCGVLAKPYLETGRNIYDIRDVCYDECYAEMDNFSRYLNLPEVQMELGVEATNWEACNDDVFNRFNLHGDDWLPFHEKVADILTYQVPVLVYAGDKDFICNWLGNRAWTDKLNWWNHDEYANAKYHDWFVNGDKAGEFKSSGGLTFLRIYDAGHMVPFNQPERSLLMLNEWLKRTSGLRQ